MPVVTVTPKSDSAFTVVVEEPGSRTSHDVTVSDADAARYAPRIPKARLVKASFEFLLAREPKESILPRFDLPVIERYFPEYPRVIAGLLRSET